jgi:hypothetical protein
MKNAETEHRTEDRGQDQVGERAGAPRARFIEQSKPTRRIQALTLSLYFYSRIKQN